MKKTIFAFAVATVGLGGCMTYDPYTGEKEVSKATTGSIIGAIGGAAIGAATSSKSDRGKGALIGAASGAAVGGGIGYYMDRQEAALRAELQGSGVSVSRSGDNLVLNMPGNVTFHTDSSDLQPQFFNVLDSVAKVLQEYESTVVRVEGHTDSTGTLEHNQALSERRASTVASYLHGRGVREQRLMAAGFGPNRPVDTNATDAGRQANRRVEITLVPVTG